tara:strand:- start:12766 stop:13452 length:687 start_codon:yes stop_codon:yes gene_type:complete
MTIETSQVTAEFSIQMRRYKDFAGIKIDVPMEVRHWIMNTNRKRDGVEQWIVPLSVLDEAIDNLSELLIMTSEFKGHWHHVYTQNFLDNYRSGQTCRDIDFEDMVEKDIDVLDLSEDQQSRIYQFSSWDHWVRRAGVVEPRDLLLNAWPTYYGNAKDIKAKALENERTVSVDIEPNTCWQNHDISGTHEVWIRVRLSEEELANYLEKDIHDRERYVFVELLGLARADT